MPFFQLLDDFGPPVCVIHLALEILQKVRKTCILYSLKCFLQRTALQIQVVELPKKNQLSWKYFYICVTQIYVWEFFAFCHFNWNVLKRIVIHVKFLKVLQLIYLGRNNLDIVETKVQNHKILETIDFWGYLLQTVIINSEGSRFPNLINFLV